MPRILSYADNSDTSAMNLEVVMLCAGILLAAAAAAFVPVAIAWSRRHRRPEAVALAAILWAVVAAAGVSRPVLARMDYAREWGRRIATGYYDPQDQSDAPALPWLLWGTLGAVYCALIAWSRYGGRGVPAEPD